MLPPRVVCVLPLRIDDGAFPDLHNAVARSKPGSFRSINEIHMRPLVAVMVNIVCYLAEQYALVFENAERLPQKQRKGVGEGVAVLLGGLQDEAESLVEVFFVVLALIRNVWRIIYNDIELAVFKEVHVRVVPNDIWFILWIDVKPNHWALAPPPKPSSIDSGIQNFSRRISGIKLEYPL